MVPDIAWLESPPIIASWLPGLCKFDRTRPGRAELFRFELFAAGRE